MEILIFIMEKIGVKVNLQPLEEKLQPLEKKLQPLEEKQHPENFNAVVCFVSITPGLSKHFQIIKFFSPFIVSGNGSLSLFSL